MKRKQKLITLILSGILLLTLILPSGLVLAEDKRSQVDFTVDDIQQAGIEDRNFAQAIYDSITAQPNKFLNGNTLDNNTYTSMEELLNSFTGNINASGRDIESIIGIPVLKSMTLLDLSNNLITDLRPLAVTKATSLSEVTVEEQHYYGIYGINCKVDFRGNWVRKYPYIVGGRLDFVSLMNLPGYEIPIDDLNLIYISDGSDSFSGDYIIPIGELYMGNNRIYFLKTATDLLTPSLDFPNTNDPKAYIPDGVQTEGYITEMPVAGIKNTGTFDLVIGSQQVMHSYFVTPRDGATPDGTSPKFYIPVQTKIYSKIEKGNTDTNHSISLMKLGVDDNKPKAGAEYSLYKKANDELVKEKLITGSNGLLTVDSLKAGEYYFVETKAPKGYELDPTPIAFTVENGSIDILGGTGNKLTPTDGEEQTIDGTFVLSGSDESPASVVIKEPENGAFDTLSLDWTDGNQGGAAGKVVYQLGTETDTDGTIYVASKEEAELKAVEKLKECRDLYQNVKISASFHQKIELSQVDELAKTVDKTVTKVWDDKENQDGIRPTEISVQLYAGNKAVGDAVKLNADNKWSFTWTNLEKFADGKEISYSIKEAAVPDGYTDKVQIDKDGNFTLTNTHTPDPNKPIDPDKPTTPDQPTKPEVAIQQATPNTNTPQTGDSTNLGILTVVLIVSSAVLAFGLLAIFRMKRKR